MGLSLSDEQRLDWLQLIRTPRVGPALFQDLVNHFGSAAAALEAVPDMAARRGAPIKPSDRGDAAREMANVHKLGARFLARGEAGYPVLLAKTDCPPPLLCASIEQLDVAKKPGVAIVGARNGSAGGLSVARAMAQELGEAGFAVISGLARGIDSAAHLGSLETGTIAFVAGGLAKPYPPENADLMRQIVARGGAVYSEVPLDWTARAQDFPRRNRLVAGSCIALVVVEAARRSGSLITARQALDLGREVMAVPGFPMDPRSEGPNSLIRDGAKLVRNAADVVAEIGVLDAQGFGIQSLGEAQPYARNAQVQPDLLREDEAGPPLHSTGEDSGGEVTAGKPRPGFDLSGAVEQRLNDAMGFSPIATDVLVAQTALPAQLVRVWLLENELSGRIVRSRGDRFAWNPDGRAVET